MVYTLLSSTMQINDETKSRIKCQRLNWKIYRKCCQIFDWNLRKKIKEMSYKNTSLIYIKQQKAAMRCQNNMYNNNHKRCIKTADKKIIKDYNELGQFDN
jgi:hypothetical protein